MFIRHLPSPYSARDCFKYFVNINSFGLEVDSVVIHIVQVRKQRHREVIGIQVVGLYNLWAIAFPSVKEVSVLKASMLMVPNVKNIFLGYA